MRASAEIVIERPLDAVWRWASDPQQLAPLRRRIEVQLARLKQMVELEAVF